MNEELKTCQLCGLKYRDSDQKYIERLPWHEAPVWAKWAAMDVGGVWWWHGEPPRLVAPRSSKGCWKPNEYRNRCFRGPATSRPWYQTLTPRPEKWRK